MAYDSKEVAKLQRLMGLDISEEDRIDILFKKLIHINERVSGMVEQGKDVSTPGKVMFTLRTIEMIEYRWYMTLDDARKLKARIKRLAPTEGVLLNGMILLRKDIAYMDISSEPDQLQYETIKFTEGE